MTVQLPYNPNPHPPGQAPIPVWIPPPPGYPPPLQGFARIKWIPISRPPTLFIPPTNTTFHLFKYLPPELRLRIWSFATPSDRVIEIRSWGSGRYAPVKFSAHPHRLPTIFRVCKESRLEAHRIYRPIEIGVSAAVKLDTRTYVPWKYHPTNPAADPGLTVGTAPLPYAEPYEPAKVRVSWDRDVIYLGPEFQPRHLLAFLTSPPPGFELPGLQRLALGHKLFAGSEDGRWDTLRTVLWSLKKRGQFRELIVVPDDERNALVDRWYYGKHDIQLRDPEWSYAFRPDGGEVARGFVDNLGEWFERLWNPPLPSLPSSSSSSSHTTDGQNDEEDVEDVDDNASVGTLTGDEKTMVVGRKPPEVTVKSVRRNGRRMAEFKDGIWEIQEAIGDMRVWKTWTPPEDMM